MGRARILLVAGVLFSCSLGLQPSQAQEKKGKSPVPSLKSLNGQPIVLVANGSGGDSSLSDNLRNVAQERRVPLIVWTVPWCRHNSLAFDHIDREAHGKAAIRMASLAQAIRKECPDSPLSLLGHSAGCHVVLQAAAMLPEKSLESIFLLAPSVSCVYDVTPALRTTRCSLVSYWSTGDTALELATDILGTADGLSMECAGRVGFRVPRRVTEAHPDLYAKFHQVRWREGMGGLGGHSSWIREPFLRRHLLPSMLNLVP